LLSETHVITAKHTCSARHISGLPRFSVHLLLKPQYIAAAGIAQDKKGSLFRAAIGRTGKLSERSMSRVDAWYVVRRRARDAGIETAIGNHSFRAIGITDYLERGGDINIAKRMAGHSNVKTTELYDRRGDEVRFSEIERVGI
jgi:integrase/recombinase XerD